MEKMSDIEPWLKSGYSFLELRSFLVISPLFGIPLENFSFIRLGFILILWLIIGIFVLARMSKFEFFQSTIQKKYLIQFNRNPIQISYDQIVSMEYSSTIKGNYSLMAKTTSGSKVFIPFNLSESKELKQGLKEIQVNHIKFNF